MGVGSGSSVGVAEAGRVFMIVGMIMLGRRSPVEVAMGSMSEGMVGMIGVARARAAVLMMRSVSFIVEISFIRS